jgi:hypothetical protein
MAGGHDFTPCLAASSHHNIELRNKQLHQRNSYAIRSHRVEPPLDPQHYRTRGNTLEAFGCWQR